MMKNTRASTTQSVMMLTLYLPTGDFFIVNNEPVGHGWGQFDSLQPETHVAFLQNLIVQTMFQRNDCIDTRTHKD